MQEFQYKNSLNNTNKNLVLKYNGEERLSLLAYSDAKIIAKVYNPENERLYQILSSEVEFINSMRNVNNSKISDYYETIQTIIKDFTNSIELIRRLKFFLTKSSEIVNCLNVSTACDYLIKNSCDVLNCERASIFVYEKTIDKLMLKSSIGLKNNISIDVNQGIVGWVFSKGQKVNIDDVYQDRRFFKEVDQMTNYRTRSCICLPLRDVKGNIFGAIQCINKKTGTFNLDDEEIMEIFSKQTGAILKNSIYFEDMNYNILRMKMITTFAVDIQSISKIETFIEQSLKLLNCLLKVTLSQILFVSYDNKLKKLNEATNASDTLNFNNYKLLDNNIGIVGQVYKKKCFLFYQKVNKNKGNYNEGIDLETRNTSIVTYPVFDQPKENNIIAIIQSEYKGRIISEEKIEDEEDMFILQDYRRIIGSWLTNYIINNNENKA